MLDATPEQPDLFAPEQLDLFHEESLRNPEGFAMPDGTTVAERPDQPSDFTVVREGAAAT